MLKAVLFDLDGTLANSDPLHFKIWQEILEKQGIEMDHAAYKAKISGRHNPEIIQAFFPDYSVAESEELAEFKEEEFRQRATQLQPLTGVMDMINWVENQQLKKAVVTNAPKKNAYFMLDALKLTQRFPLVVLGEEMTVGKPDPECYQFCLQQLGVEPAEAIVFEDSPSGIRSAIAAGIETIGVASTHEPEALKQLGVSLVIKDFTDKIMWQKLKRLNSQTESNLTL